MKQLFLYSDNLPSWCDQIETTIQELLYFFWQLNAVRIFSFLGNKVTISFLKGKFIMDIIIFLVHLRIGHRDGNQDYKAKSEDGEGFYFLNFAINRAVVVAQIRSLNPNIGKDVCNNFIFI